LKITFPHPSGHGGPGSFQERISKELANNGWTVTYPSSTHTPDLVFIIGGTRKLFWLIKLKLKKVPIVLRLDGINWLHRKKSIKSAKYLKAEIQNVILKVLHAFIADYIVYQSHFVKSWWERNGLKNHVPFSVIKNGVDTDKFKTFNKKDKIRLVCLEGTLDYSPYTVNLLNQLSVHLKDKLDIHLYGKFEDDTARVSLSNHIFYHGAIGRDDVPSAMQNSIYLSLDVNPACPNTVIEALACGSPVIGFDTGALKELVQEDCGVIVPYGSDPWKLQMPDVQALKNAIQVVLNNYEKYSKNARLFAEQHYRFENVFKMYESIFINLTEKKI
jgi:glycosyltransferase involved in cell wall biosynthesis